MPLQKQNLALPFAVSLDTKTDPLQLASSSMLELSNVVYTKDKRLGKRNGFGNLTSLPEDSQISTCTTFKGSLTVLGANLYTYVPESESWLTKGRFQSVGVNVYPLVRSSSAQTACDVQVAPSDPLSCAVFSDGGTYKYQVSNSVTGQVIVAPTALPATATQARVFVLGQRFVMTFMATVGGSPHLQYIAVPFTAPTNPSSATDISASVSGLTAGYDGFVANSNLYISWNGSDGGGAVRTTYIDSGLNQHNTVVQSSKVANKMSVTADITGTTAVVWVTFYTTSSTNIYTMAFDHQLTQVLAPTVVDTGNTVVEITSSAQDALLSVFHEVQQNYAYVSVRSDYIRTNTCTQAGVAGTASVLRRGVGLASKAFLVDTVSYMLVTYSGTFQPTYFLMDGAGYTVAKLAYENGGGLVSTQVLPSVSLVDEVAEVGYLFKDLLVPVNDAQGAATTAGVYTQTGVNVARFDLSKRNLSNVEIGNNLHIEGGFLWMYDGNFIGEHSFHLFPEDVLVTTSGAGGLITAQQYYYVATYEWTDAQGNIHRSAPSIPYGIVATGATSTNTIKVPTLRLTYKTSVRIVGYRWSTAQQNYYQFTSITSPTLNDTTVDYVTITDTLADSAILGNPLVYTTGGVVENIAAPPCTGLCLYKSRLALIDAEDRDVLWYSKQVIEGVPVETSDLFTIFVPPTTGSQGSTGPNTALFSMDDKLVPLKDNAIYYIVGNGPDNTGANNDFSDPIYVASTVGCSNQASLALIPQGVMFQSDKGIWLLGRDLSTSYIGAPVEDFNSQSVLSSTLVPGTNQVRFCLDNGRSLMFDYFYRRWGSFSNLDGQSSTLYGGLHTYINALGQVRQETPGEYLDGGTPVLISWKGAWINLAGLQGYERAYMVYILGQYLSPHKMSISIAYDYNPSPEQQVLISPNLASPAYGEGNYFGQDSPYGGPGTLEQWRIFLKKQRCQAFQLTFQEVYDASIGPMPGAGLTLSGLNLVVGLKKAYKPQSASKSIG